MRPHVLGDDDVYQNARILADVSNALQPAEELGGPTGYAYVKLMEDVIDYAQRSIRFYTKERLLSNQDIEIITFTCHKGEPLCLCGNDPACEGYLACDSDGNLWGGAAGLPEPAERPFLLYSCQRCSRIINFETGEVLN